MSILCRNGILFLLLITLISCNGQMNYNKATQEILEASKTHKINVPKNGFSSAYVDNLGHLWFGSNGGGVFFFDGNSFTNYTMKDGLSSNRVFSIVEDDKNNFWFGTQNGLTKYDGKRFENITLPYQDTSGSWLSKVNSVVSPNAAQSLALDNKGNIWIGTGAGGAYEYDGKKFTPHLRAIGARQADSLFHNWIPAITKDRNGNIWFASMSQGGVNRFDGTSFTQFLREDGLSDNQVRSIYCDKMGHIWIGYNGNRNSGLTMFDGTLFKTYSVEEGLCNKRTWAIYEDENDKLWIGGDLETLCVFDGQNFTEFKYQEKTFSNVYFILADQEDNIWFGGKNGIWRYDSEVVAQMTK